MLISITFLCLTKLRPTPAGLEPTRDKPNRFLVDRLNRSATVPDTSLTDEKNFSIIIPQAPETLKEAWVRDSGLVRFLSCATTQEIYQKERHGTREQRNKDRYYECVKRCSPGV
jgi:hypothetical protein